MSRVNNVYPGRHGGVVAKLPGAVGLDFLLSLRDYQTLNCVKLDLKFNFLILHVLLLCLAEGKSTGTEASLPSEQFLKV